MTTSTADFLSLPLSALLVDTLDVDWTQALCADSDENPEDWFPFPADDFAHAADVCARCPIRIDCERWGRTNRMTGVWGGVRLVNGRAS